VSQVVITEAVGVAWRDNAPEVGWQLMHLRAHEVRPFDEPGPVFGRSGTIQFDEVFNGLPLNGTAAFSALQAGGKSQRL
jgi:hypothetical protein